MPFVKRAKDPTALRYEQRLRNHWGQRLRDAREARDLSQTAVGDALGVTGQAVGQWENGTSAPLTLYRVRLAVLFGVSVDHLFTPLALDDLDGAA